MMDFKSMIYPKEKPGGWVGKNEKEQERSRGVVKLEMQLAFLFQNFEREK